MKICFVVDENLYRPAGVQYYVLDLAVWLLDRGHEVTVLHSANASIPPRELDSRLDVIDIAKGFEIPYFSPNGGVSVFPGVASRALVREVLATHDFDVVHFNYPFSPLVSGVVIRELRALQRATGVKPRTVATLHVYVEEHKGRMAANRALALAQRGAIKFLDVVVDTGTPTAHYATKYMKRTSEHVPIGIANSPEPPHVHKDGKRRILFLGRLQERKGVLEFIEALRQIQPRSLVDNAIITVAGDGPQRTQAEEAAREAGLDIEFVGAVHDEKVDLYRQADIAVFPTRYGETFGIVLLEAMNHHALAVGYANVGYASTMRDLAESSLVPSEDRAALAGLLSELLALDDVELRERQAEHKAFFEAHYDIDMVYPTLLEIYSR